MSREKIMQSQNTKIKICGLSRMEDAQAVNECLPDYVGFVFWEKSKRYVEETQAALLRETIDQRIPCVGVFVDEKPEKIIGLLQNGVIQIAQLHGNETEEEVYHIKKESGCPVIKALQIQSGEELREWKKTCADYLLLDGGMGEGKIFDWNLIGAYIEKPFFLAGGLHNKNVMDAIDRVKPFAVDISSGVETEGKKDKSKIAQIVRRVRNE